MEPYVCRSGDYFFLIDNEEVEKLKISQLEDTLLFEGGEPTDKKGRLSFEPNGDTKLILKRHPENASSWEEIKVIELVLNGKGYDELYFGGLVKWGELGIDYYVQDILRPNFHM